MPTVLQGSTLTLELVVEPVTPEGPVPTMADVLVDIINPSEVEVVTDAAATEDPSPPEEGTARWTYDFVAAEDAALGDWTIHWTATVNGEPLESEETFTVGLAQEVYFTVEEAHELAGMSAIPDADIEEARARIEELIEKIAGVAFVPRTRTVTLSGRSTNDLTLGDWFIRGVTALSTRDGSTSTAYDASALANLGFGSKRVYRQDGTVFPWGTHNVTVTYTYGMDEPPLPVKRAALLMCQASFVLTDSEGNQQGPSGVLLEIPEVQQLLEPYILKNSVYSIQIGAV